MLSISHTLDKPLHKQLQQKKKKKKFKHSKYPNNNKIISKTEYEIKEGKW